MTRPGFVVPYLLELGARRHLQLLRIGQLGFPLLVLLGHLIAELAAPAIEVLAQIVHRIEPAVVAAFALEFGARWRWSDCSFRRSARGVRCPFEGSSLSERLAAGASPARRLSQQR